MVLEITDLSHQSGSYLELKSDRLFKSNEPGVYPPLLTEGQIVRIVSPAGPIEEGSLDYSINLLKSWGLQIEEGRNVYVKNGYLAGSDEQRATDLVEALRDPNVNGVISSRGGYGSLRILDKIPWKEFKQSTPKYFSGFSDIGVLQVNLWQLSGWITYSGLQAVNGLSERTPQPVIEQFKSKIMIRDSEAPQSGDSMALRAMREGDSEGVLLPICLTMLMSLLETHYCPNLSNVILCIEDIAEAPYRVDRMFWQLSDSGKLRDISCLVLGCFYFNGKNVIEEVELSALHHFANEPFPIYSGLQYGHALDRLTLPIGAKSEILDSHLTIHSNYRH